MGQAEFWNQRYGEVSYAYGTKPNNFLREVVDSLTPGRILLPCAGEGRNAVYAAHRGWEVLAIDQAEEGRKKAFHLAGQHNVSINYSIGDVNGFRYLPETMDAIGLFYAHLPRAERVQLIGKMLKALKKGGSILIEAFAADQIGRSSGGPGQVELAYSVKELQRILNAFSLYVWKNVSWCWMRANFIRALLP